MNGYVISYFISAFLWLQIFCFQLRKLKTFPQYFLFPLKANLELKSSQKLNALVLFSLITSEIFQLTHRYRYQVVGEVMTDV